MSEKLSQQERIDAANKRIAELTQDLVDWDSKWNFYTCLRRVGAIGSKPSGPSLQEQMELDTLFASDAVQGGYQIALKLDDAKLELICAKYNQKNPTLLHPASGGQVGSGASTATPGAKPTSGLAKNGEKGSSSVLHNVWSTVKSTLGICTCGGQPADACFDDPLLEKLLRVGEGD